MKKILVTGGCGFIGHHVVDNLLAKGYEVTVMDRFAKPLWDPRIKFFLADITNAEAVMDVVGKHDGVINLAGILGTAENVGTPREGIKANVDGAINIFEAVKRHKVKAVQITVGNHTWNNTYAITKSMAERLALMYNKEHGTKIAVVRGLNVFGEYQLHYPIEKITPNFIVKAMKNEPVKIYGDGEQLLDVIYAGDTAEILVRALVNDHGCYDMVMEAGLGKPVTANYFAEKVIEFAGSTSTLDHVPMRAGEPLRSVTVGDPATLAPLGELNMTPFEQGLKQTVDWYKAHYWEFYETLSVKH